MKTKRLLYFLLCMVVFLTETTAMPFLPSAEAERPDMDEPPIQSGLSYRRFTTHDGLPQMQTELVWQDSQGYIYIGTLSGFVRYDGRSLTPFLKGQRENIVGFQELMDGKGSKESHVRAMGFVRQWDIKGNDVVKTVIDPLGNMLLNNFNAADLPPGYVLLEDRQEQNRQLCLVERQGIKNVMTNAIFDEMTPDRKMYIDQTTTYVPTPKGLYVVENKKSRLLSMKDDVFSLFRINTVLYALASDGIYSVKDDSLVCLYEFHFNAPDYGLYVRQNKQGQLIIADAHTIWLYDPHAAATPMRQLASGINMIKNVFIDRWDRLWVATYQGAYCFFCYNFTNHRLTDKNDIVRAMASCNGQMVFGTLNGKVIVGGQLISEETDNYFAPNATAIDNTVYMAGNGDIAAIHGDTLEWLGLPYDKYQFVTKAKDSDTSSWRLIIGTRNSILAYHPSTHVIDTLATDIPRPWCMADDGEGRLWFSVNPGLYYLAQQENEKDEMKEVRGTPGNSVITTMTTDYQGHVFFAIGDSLFSIHQEEVALMSELQPLLSGHEIRAIHISSRGFLIVATIDGLMVARIDEKGFVNESQWFDSQNGFTMIEPLMATMTESEDGTVWLAGLEEMTSFNPEHLLTINTQSTIVETPRPWWKRWWMWMIGACLLSLFVWRLARWFEQRQAKKKMIDLLREKRQKELQLSAIRLKAIPHFHSNVLASIEYFMMNNSADEATHYLKLYSDFTNQTLTDINLPARSIAEEIDYVRTYMELEQLRYGERLQYHIDVATDVDQNVMLPTMILHTYCQNAVKHGIANKVGTGNVEVMISRMQRDGVDGVLVAVKDDGVGRTEAAVLSGNNSTKQGLKILKQQIELYNQTNNHKIKQNVIDLTDADGRPAGTCFEIWVPTDYKY